MGLCLKGISEFLIKREGRRTQLRGEQDTGSPVWLLLVPCPVATSSLSHHPELLNNVEKSTALGCPPSPSAQHCSVWQVPHPYPDLSTDPRQALLGGCWPKPWGYTWGTVPGVLPSTHLLPVQYDPQAGQLPERWGRSCPVRSPSSLPRLWAQLLPCCASLCLAPSLAFAKHWGHAQHINVLSLHPRRG